MKNVLRLMMACVFALGIAACDDIIIPDHPGGGNGGNPGDSTGTGGGGRDTTGGGGRDTTGGGGNNDTTRGEVFVFTGQFVDMMGMPTSAPEESHLYVAWDMGNGSEYVLGQGQIQRSPRGDFFTVSIAADRWPEEALFDPDGSGGIHGVARLVLSQNQYDDNQIIEARPGIPPLGMMTNLSIIYNTGREKATPWTLGWIDGFDVGISLAITAFNGWVPASASGMAITPEVVVFQ